MPRWGATVTGARNFLIAYNINLLSTKEQAHRIALNIREQGRGGEQVRYRVDQKMALNIREQGRGWEQVGYRVDQRAGTSNSSEHKGAGAGRGTGKVQGRPKSRHIG